MGNLVGKAPSKHALGRSNVSSAISRRGLQVADTGRCVEVRDRKEKCGVCGTAGLCCALSPHGQPPEAITPVSSLLFPTNSPSSVAISRTLHEGRLSRLHAFLTLT